MKVLAVSGSPRSNGNTEILLRHALQPFQAEGWDVAEFFCSAKVVKPCAGCETCRKTGGCVITNDDMALFCREFSECDALLIGSPAYYRNVTAQLKAVFDRSFGLHDTSVSKIKAGGAIAVGRGEDGGQSITLTVIYNYFLSMGVLCVPGELNGVAAQADRPGDILKQENRLRQARVLGEKVMKYAELLNNEKLG